MLYAIIIGIDKYIDHNIRNLTYARQDAETFGRLIEDQIHPAEREVTYLLDSEATYRNLRVAIGEDLPRLVHKEDIVLLYFAGHGSPETVASPDDVSRYLIMHDTEYENIYATGIDMERDVVRLFERLETPKLILLFIDACFSGRAGGRTFEGPRLKKTLADFRAGKISLKNLELGEGRVMVTACDDNQVAREYRELGHGVFTYFLLESLKTPKQNKNTISIHTLYEEVAEAVKNYTKGRQIPIINGRSRMAQLPRFYFSKFEGGCNV